MPWKDPEVRRDRQRAGQRRRRAAARDQQRADAERVRRERVQPPPTIRAWAAGYFEGDGMVTINWNSRYGHTRPCVHTVNTDKGLIDIVDRWWPGQRRTITGKARARDAYQWSRYSVEGVREFLLDVAPFFRSGRSMMLAEIVLEDLDDRRRGSRDPDYREPCASRLALVRVLNHRGTGPMNYRMPEPDSDGFLRLQRAIKVLDENDV